MEAARKRDVWTRLSRHVASSATKPILKLTAEWQGDPDVQDLRDLWVEGRGQLMLSITAKIEAEIDERAADEMSFFMDPFWRSSSDQPERVGKWLLYACMLNHAGAALSSRSTRGPSMCGTRSNERLSCTRPSAATPKL